ncbi:DEAD/DEAH box helicase [Singulisphaera sp. PoT]|uniref:DEAD/DEAH box helicase n=1 Tax=Singulisphaera sp. PoT TaxID=3411797 RepID=UPI003BF46AC1
MSIVCKPRLNPSRVVLRPYQEDAIDAARREFRRGVRSTLIVLPTGLGKTVVFGAIARKVVERGGRVLVLAHRDELIQQAVNKLEQLGVDCGIEKAASYARAIFEPDVVVATVQTMQRDRLQSWPRDHFRLVVTDEAHHATSDTYTRVYSHFETALHLGVTATSDRSDETDLGKVFESVAYEVSLWDAMTAPPPGPYLSRLRFVQCDVDIDLRGLRTTVGDFNQADLEDRIAPLIETLANAIRQEVGNRQTLVFTPDVTSAQAMASALQSLGLVADWVAGDDADRRLKIDRLQSGDLQILCNCALLTEGFDSPSISAIALCRPTQSRSLFAQMVGRGTRLARGKDDCLLIDFNYLTAKHDLVKATALLASPGTDAEVIEIAQKLATRQKGLDLVDVIEQAREEHSRRQIIKIHAQKREVAYRKVSYDPVSVFENLGMTWRGSRDKPVNGATTKQVEHLKKLGVVGAESISKQRANTLIGVLHERKRLGLATQKQVAVLIARGIDPETARSMSICDASAELDRLIGQRP